MMENHVFTNIVGEIIPIIFQFSTMVFGLIRKHSKKAPRLAPEPTISDINSIDS